MAWIVGIRGVILDVDGTLLNGDVAIPGAAEAISRLRARKIPFRFVTNTTRRSRAAVAEALSRAGIPAEEVEVLAPSVLALRRVLASGRPRAALLVPPESRRDFEGIQEDERNPAWVVVGDLGRGFTWDLMNRAFHWLRAGARLLALHKNRAWHAGAEGLVIDAGPFIAALEYAAGVEAEVIGKPSPAFFELSLADLGCEAKDALVVGDDLENDCVGGAAAGCRTALVGTGKFEGAALALSGVAPDLVLDSVADLL